jgi:hypothetical protein
MNILQNFIETAKSVRAPPQSCRKSNKIMLSLQWLRNDSIRREAGVSTPA